MLRGIGVLISKRQVVRLLIAGKQSFVEEARAVLRAGLTCAAWITADDTGARHEGKNGFCAQIGNAHFTYFATTGSKSRLNFLELLRAGHDDYVVNEQALAYMPTARSPDPSSPTSASIPIASSPTARPGTFIWTNSASRL